MFELVELCREDGGVVFEEVEGRLAWLERAWLLGLRWGVGVRAFRLERRRLRLVVEGGTTGMSHWLRLCRSGHAVWSRHRGEVLYWMPAERQPLPGEAAARRAADALHRGGADDPLLNPWTSLWDGLGARRARWFDPGWLRASPAEELLRGAGGLRAPELSLAPVAWADWPLVQAAVAAGTGDDPDGRQRRVLRFQLAARCGWTTEALAALGGVSTAAVRKALRQPPRRSLAASLTHLRDPRLRARLEASAPGVRGADRAWVRPVAGLRWG